MYCKLKKDRKSFIAQGFKNIILHLRTDTLYRFFICTIMKIKILAFGIAKEIIGAQSIEKQVEKNTKVSSLKSLLETDYPALKALKSYSIAVNQEYVEDGLVLSEQDEVVLLPPVSGG